MYKLSFLNNINVDIKKRKCELLKHQLIHDGQRLQQLTHEFFHRHGASGGRTWNQLEIKSKDRLGRIPKISKMNHTMITVEKNTNI